MTRINLLFAIFALTFVSLAAGSAAAQYRVPVRPTTPPAPSCTGVPSVYIRNLRYDDYTRYSRLSTNTVAPGGFIQIVTNCMNIDGAVHVTLQDVNRGNGYGVTAFRLTNVRWSGNVITAQMPNHPIFRNRTFHIGLFVYGQPWKTANPGSVTIQ